MTEMRAKLVVEADASSVSAETQRMAGGLDTISKSADKAATSLGRVSSESQEVSRVQQRLNTTFNGFGANTKSARESAQAIEQAMQARNAYRALEESIDPLIRAERELAEATRIVNAAKAAGVASDTEAARSAQILHARYDALVAAQTRVAGSSRVMRAGVQNASYQVADMAVQLQAGVAASTVFAQQVPQLLGGMGVMGAVMGAVVAVGAPFVAMMLQSDNAAGSLDDRLTGLDATLASIADRFKILRDQDLSLTFGSLAGDVRELTAVMLELERAAELKELKNAIDGTIDTELKPNKLQRYLIGSPFVAVPDRYAVTENLREANYNSITGGRGPGYDEFTARSTGIMDLAKAGEIEKVVSEINILVKEFADGGPLTDLDDKLLAILQNLAATAQKTAEIEALFNGSAREALIEKEVTALVDGYRQQADLAEAVARHGETSAAVEALRNRQAREALELRLHELGVEDESAEAQAAIAALEAAQAAEAQLRAAERDAAIRETLSGLDNELAISQAIAANGEKSAEVEALRAEQARAALRLRLQEMGATEDQIAQAETLLDQQREATRAAAAAKAERDAAKSIDEMRRQAEIDAAILALGKDSLEVKRLKIEAARAEYVQSLATLQVTQETKDALLAAWDAAKGLSSVDPFGTLAAGQAMLEAQNKAIAKLQLEQQLLGQTEAMRRRVLALYEAELEIRQKGIAAESDLADRIRDGALAEADLAADLARQVDAWERVSSGAEDAIDRIVDAAMEADLPGVFDGIAQEIEGILTDLAIRNPLKNMLLGTDYATLDDVGGLSGLWTRLIGGAADLDPASAAAQAAARSVATMQVTAGTVVIGGSGISQFAGGGLGDGLAGGLRPAANLPTTPVPSQVWNFFAGKGLAPHQIAGILGNISAESSFDPFARGDNGTSFGLFQHHGARADGLLSSIGGTAGLGDVQAQLEFVWQELLTTERAALEKLLASGTVGEATSAWMTGFERPAAWAQAQSWPGRLGAAEEALERFGATTATATADLGTLGTGFDVFGSTLSNALSGALGGDGGGLGGLLGTIGSAIAGGLGLPGFSIGGPTGGSDPSRVAGLVHENEYVFDAISTQRIGVQTLDAVRRGALKGYRSGGLATARDYPLFASVSGAAQDAGAIDTRPIITIENATSVPFDARVEETEGPRGQRQYVLSLSDAVSTGLTAPGGAAAKTLATTYGVRPRVRARS